MAVSDAALVAAFGRPDDAGAFGGAVAKERQARVKYWRKPDGWIGIGPEVGTDAPKYQQWIRKGWRELPDYFGKEIMGKGTIVPGHAYPRGSEHFWLETFFKNGGHTYVCKATDPFGKEGEYIMPAAQLISMGMHRHADVRAARPDLEMAVEVPCPYGCVEERTGRPRQFVGSNKEIAESSRDQHIVAVHKDAVASRAVGDTIAKAMEGMQGTSINAETIAAIVAATVAAIQGTSAAAPIAAVAVENQEWVIPDPTVDVDAEVADDAILPTASDIAATQSPEVLTRQDIESMSRSELMSWAYKHKELFRHGLPENPLNSGNREAWIRRFYESLYPDLLTS